MIKTTESKFQHFTFIIQENKVIGYGMNRKGDPSKMFGYPDYANIHSESDAFRRCRVDIKKDFSVVNVRLNRFGDFRNSKPCECCYGFLDSLGVKEIYFTTDIGWCKIV